MSFFIIIQTYQCNFRRIYFWKKKIKLIKWVCVWRNNNSTGWINSIFISIIEFQNKQYTLQSWKNNWINKYTTNEMWNRWTLFVSIFCFVSVKELDLLCICDNMKMLKIYTHSYCELIKLEFPVFFIWVKNIETYIFEICFCSSVHLN